MRRSGYRLLWLVLLALAGGPRAAWAASYAFPGSLPAGCSGSAGSYSCSSLSLAYGDTVTVGAPTPATLTINGDLQTNNAQINVAGSAASLSLVVTGTLTVAYGARINANVTAGSIVDPSGSVVFGGSLATTTGSIALAFNSSVAGSISSTSGAITLAQDNVVGGSVTSSSGAIDLGYQGSVAGSVSTTGTIKVGQSGQVAGTVTGGSGNIDIGYAAQVAGNVTSSSGTIALGGSSTVQACVKSTASAAITLAWASSAGGVCCGSNSCGSACVVNNSGASMPATCVAPPLAEYRFEEASWNGTAGEIVDSSGNGRHGTRVGSAAATASGKVCRGADIPANTSNTSSAINTGIDVDSTIGSAGTVSFWYRGNGAWGSGNDLQLFDATTTSNRSFHLVRRGNGSLRFAVTDSGGTSITASSSNLAYAAGTWVYVTATWNLVAGSNASSLAVRINGASVASATGTTTGSLHSSIGTLYVGDSRANITSNNATVNSADGRFDELRIYGYVINATTLANDMAATRSCASSLHHLELRHASGSGLTCTPSTLTVAACQDAACTVAYTGGLTGSLTASGAGATVNWPAGTAFTIAAGSSTTTLDLQLTTVGSVLLGSSGVSPSPGAATSCNFGSPSCTFSAADSGFVFNVPDHVAETTQTLTVSAVKKADNGTTCTPAFASTSKAITFKCANANPATGTLPVRVGGAALNAANSAAAACDASGRSVSLAFGAGGTASTSVAYADVGQVTLTASYTGSGSEAGLVMTGSDGFVSAPASFAFSAISAAPLRAGSAFSATVTARNSAGNATPNFGRESSAESVSLSFTRRSPSGAGASNGLFSGSVGAFGGGSATASNLVWSEVGTGDLAATLASGDYLGSGLSATGSTGTAGAVGRFVPHHFDVAVTPACGTFSYGGQPFAVSVTARNGLATPTTTVNYDGSAATTPTFAKALTLSDVPALAPGTWSGTSLAASAFVAGVANAAPSYAFSQKATAPQSTALRAVDADAVTSAGAREDSVLLRSGRLRMSAAFGSEKASLSMPVFAEYWTGQAWLLNGDDHCTVVPSAAIALSGRRSGQGSATNAWTNTASAITLASGQGSLVLGAPTPAATGTVEVALNLGSTGTDQSCLSNHPATTGAARGWLRAQNGSCAASADRDPSARASFGIFSPESARTVHARELY